MDREKLIKEIDSITKQLKEFIGNRKAILGLSGGIDSSVVAYLCVNAVGKENVIGITMPYANQSSEDGQLIADSLDIRCDHVNISSIVEGFPKYVAPIHADGGKLVKGNLMARVRMAVLYEYANAHNGFVIGTTNRTEAEIGYYTKYGDGAVDVEPVACWYKTDMWDVARIMGVPQKNIDRVPSAELWDDQTDEDEIGLPYPELDAILKQFHKMEKTLFQVMYGSNGAKVVAMVRNSEHKRHMPPSFQP